MATYIKTQPKTCEVCQTTFYRRPRCAFKYWVRAKFCSLECRGKRVMTVEHKKAVIAGLNKNPHRYKKGEKPWNWKVDRNQIKIGDRNLHDPNYKQWHRAVKNRDGWKCKISNGDCSGRLEAHHILPWSRFPELRYEVNNGIALCHAHHPRKREDEIKLSPYFQSLVASQE